VEVHGLLANGAPYRYDLSSYGDGENAVIGTKVTRPQYLLLVYDA